MQQETADLRKNNKGLHVLKLAENDLKTIADEILDSKE